VEQEAAGRRQWSGQGQQVSGAGVGAEAGRGSGVGSSRQQAENQELEVEWEQQRRWAGSGRQQAGVVGREGSWMQSSCAASINRSNTAVQAVLEQPCLTGGRTGTVQPKQEPTGWTYLSNWSPLVLCNQSQELIGQACPTRRQVLWLDSACPTTAQTAVFNRLMPAVLAAGRRAGRGSGQQGGHASGIQGGREPVGGASGGLQIAGAGRQRSGFEQAGFGPKKCFPTQPNFLLG
jgi:hypothetical protein